MKKKYQIGGNQPIITHNPNDPRIKSYSDSLSLYNNGKEQLNQYWDHKFTDKEYKDYTKGSFWDTDKNEIINREGLQNDKIKPVSFTTKADLPVYKRPVQPIQYQKRSEASNELFKTHQDIKTQDNTQQIPQYNMQGKPVYGSGNSMIGTLNGNQFYPDYDNTAKRTNASDDNMILNQQVLTQFLQSKGLSNPQIQPRFQTGGDVYDNSTDFSQYANLLNGYQQQQQPDEYEEVDNPQEEQPEQGNPNYDDIYSKFSDLNDRFESLFQKYGSLLDTKEDDNATNFVNKYSEENEPIDWMSVNNDVDDYSSQLGDFHQSLNSLDQQPTQGGSISVNNNNPGNIEYGDYTKKYGATQGTERPDIKGRYYANFPSVEAGLQAQKDLLTSKNYRNLTIEKALNRWVTGDPNKQGDYSKRIANMFGNKRISDLSPQELNTVIQQQIKGEDGTQAKRLGIKQTGGFAVAQTPQQQNEGLNNPYVGVMSFPNQGTNTFRGLDNGKPVMLKDQTGKVKILTGNKHTTKMSGNVLEHRL